ncbi:helix-turn-helix transcriptional regulator [Pseudomonas sp. SWRI59]|uniref:AraC family transcriptional regulator n=1 Tax=Pseudomonas TaxID=286 RepID=UPI001646EB17|nr:MULTISPECIES: helix-turn-helix transcriptional regulator [unclassified Pseudomonas]MBC3479190.1 helix-turn-helix transcriptional regulator [Pseudomonas sp. SWRI77]MBC3501277.1 helix-turn-helix transcriptional regulator [Pseudomonas sp. SWRI59]MBC3506855.1 helix-turn-helix transcriptional regulator [Pseudomonas sp. SWRI68]UVL03447.1 helix-turn-helix transcriptional regulator [Pseudomonas sp. B21-047]
MPRKYLDIPGFDRLPAPVYLRHDEFGADTHSAPHRHAWGQLNYAAHGVMHLDVEGQRFLSPPHYAVWVPPGIEHGCYNPQAIVYRSLYLDRSLCAGLPQQPCSLVISDILKAILGDFARRDLNVAQDERDQRLVQVLLDQLLLAPTQTCYLPFARSEGLGQVLDGLSRAPGDNRPLADWARQVHVSERTLARQFIRELGIGFGEWRLRLRFLRAIEMLEAGLPIQAIAFDLGYSSASAFIAMFQRQANCTPEQYRRQARSGG